MGKPIAREVRGGLAREYDVVVVGGRVAGARTAELLALKGAKVLIIDSRKDIGNPVQCTGFVSHRFLELMPDFPKGYIYNKISKAKFHSPNGRSLYLKAKEFSVIDRQKLDNYLLKGAKKSGVEVKRGVTFLGKKLNDDYIEVITNKKILRTKLLIGADGPKSEVAKSCGINSIPQFRGMQSTVKGDFGSSTKLYFGSKTAPKYFAWIVPLNRKEAHIGLATKQDVYGYFKKFTKNKLGYIPKPDVSGLIKCGFQKELVSDRVMLIGDAASQVKPFSGGGIVYSIVASELCAHGAAVALEAGRFDKRFLSKVYQKRAHKLFRKPILRGLLIHKLWQSCPDIVMNIIFLLLIKTKSYKLVEKLDVDFY